MLKLPCHGVHERENLVHLQHRPNAITRSIFKMSCAEFFNGRSRSKSPEVYKEYRQFMVETYQLQPF